MVWPLLALVLSSSVQDSVDKTEGSQSKILVAAGIEDAAWEKTFRTYAASAERKITAFFGSSFKREVLLLLCPSRAAFDEALAKQWGMPKTEKWMVGAAGAESAFFLSPRVWKAEAAEHDPKDVKRIEMLVAHELTHSYHAQFSPSKDLEGLDPMAWFAEGLATYVSGQEASRHRGQAVKAVETGKFPERLEDVWKGQARYGLAGSLTRFVDVRFGRKKIVELLATTTNAEAMKLLGISEKDLMAAWKDWVRKGEPAGK